MSNIPKIVLSLTFLLFVSSLAYYVATNNGAEDFQRVRNDVNELRAGNEAYRAENEALRREVTALRSDARIIERHVRDDLGMIRRDEIVILLNQTDPRVR